MARLPPAELRWLNPFLIAKGKGVRAFSFSFQPLNFDMDRHVRKETLRIFFLVLFLVCALLGAILLFGHGFDAGRRFVNYPSYVCAIPFAIPLPALLLAEKTRAKSGYALSIVPSNYRRILTAALVVGSAASVLGLTILLLRAFHVWAATEGAFDLPIMGLFFIPGQLTYFIMCLVGLSNDENAKGVFLFKILSIGFLVGSLLAVAGTIVSGEQWSFFYLVSPMSLLAAVMAGED